MKKVLSALLAMLMVVSCMAGITFSVAAEGTETIAMYKGDLVNGAQYGGASAVGNTIGQVLTIPDGKVLVSIAYGITYTYGGGVQPGTIKIWKWDGSAKGTLLYTGDFSFTDNSTTSVIEILAPETANISGTIYYELSYNDSTRRLAVGGSSGGPADGVVNYYNGSANNCTGHWGCGGSAYGIGSTITVMNASTDTSMKLAGEAASTQYNWELAATEIGQRFTVPGGNILTKYTIGQLYAYGAVNNTGRVDFYQWNANYAISTAAEPLYTYEFTNTADGAPLAIEIPAEKAIGGEVIAVLTFVSGEAACWRPQGGTEAVAGVYHYADGLAYAGSLNTKGIYSWIDFEEGTANIVANDYNKVQLYTVASTPDDGTEGQFTNSAVKGAAVQSFAQKFTLDGEILACIDFHMLRHYSSGTNHHGNIKVYAWDTDYATTVAGHALFTAEINNQPTNTARSIAVPTELGLTGTLLYVVTYTSGDSQHGFVPTTGTAKDGVESFRNGTTIASVWSGHKNVRCDVYTLDMEETSYPLYNVAGGTQYTGNSNHSAKIGQTAVIPAGKVLSGLDLGSMRKTTYDNGGPVTGTFSVYQWAGSYAETVSRTPLYTQDVSYTNNQRALITIPASLMIEGNIFWELAPNSEGIGFNPDTANDQIAGTASYTNGVAKTGPWGGYIKSSLLLVDGGIYAAGETTSAGLYNGTANVDMAWGASWTVRQFGQKFTVPEGKSLKSITMKLNVSGGDGKGTLYFYSWKGGLADTLNSTPVYSEAVNVPGDNTMYTVTVPSGSGITGDVLWYLDCGSDTSPIAFGATAIGTDVLDIINGQYTNQCGGGWGLSNWNGAIALCPTVTYETASVTYINSIDKTVLYSGNVAFGNMPSVTKTAFRAAANKYANGTWGAWDGTFTHVGGGVYYTNHTFADTVTVDGVATDLNDKNYLTVEANPVGFVGWKDNTGAFVSNSVVMKWFPKSADATLTAVYEGEFAPTVSATATIKNGLLTVVVTPALNSSVSEYGYYISTTGAIDTEALDGVTKVTANNAYAAYLQRVYNLKPATTNVYVLPYIVVDGNAVYGAPVSVAA